MRNSINKIYSILLGTLFVITSLSSCLENPQNNPDDPGSSNYSGGVVDFIPPVVVQINPANGSIDVATNTNITVTFNESMNVSTINDTSFTLSYDNKAINFVDGNISYDNSTNTATFTPNESLSYLTLYTAFITQDVTDSSGNNLTENYSWSFTTGGQMDLNPPEVIPLTEYPPRSATDVELNTNISIQFNESIDASSLNNSTFIVRNLENDTNVSGGIFYNDTTKTAVFLPDDILIYNRNYSVIITTDVTDLDGNSLISIHTWTFSTISDSITPTVITTYPINLDTGLSTDTVVSATFSEPMDPLTLTPTSFTLSGVTGAVTYDADTLTATFTPSSTLSNDTTYTATITSSAADLAGNSLDEQYSWQFTTEEDIVLPTVILGSEIPAADAVDVNISTNVSIIFSEVMDEISITDATFTLTNDGPVPGVVSYSNETATFDPDSDLANSTLYTATINTGVADLAGNPLAASYSWSFTTAAPADTTAPTVLSTNPADLAVDVAVSANIMAVFSEAMNASTITVSERFTLYNNTAISPVSGTIFYNDSTNTATFVPDADLVETNNYTASISNMVQDSAGNPLGTDKTWSFTTTSAADETPPEVDSTIPADLDTGVSITSDISAIFNEAMNPATINETTFTLTDDMIIGVTGAVSYSNGTATFNPDSDLLYGVEYTATVTTGVQDTSSNSLVSDKTWSFTTDIIAPQGVTASSGASTVNITVSWDAVPGAASYNVESADSQTNPYTNEITYTTNTSYIHSGLSSSTVRWYRVWANFNNAVEGPRSSAVQGYTGSGSTSITSVSKGNAVPETVGTVDVSWSAVAPVSGTNYYYIYTNTDAISTPTQIGSFTGTTNTFNLRVGEVYYFYVRIYNTLTGYGPYSASNSQYGYTSNIAVIYNDDSKTDLILAQEIKEVLINSDDITSYRGVSGTMPKWSVTLIPQRLIPAAIDSKTYLYGDPVIITPETTIYKDPDMTYYVTAHNLGVVAMGTGGALLLDTVEKYFDEFKFTGQNPLDIGFEESRSDTVGSAYMNTWTESRSPVNVWNSPLSSESFTGTIPPKHDMETEISYKVLPWIGVIREDLSNPTGGFIFGKVAGREPLFPVIIQGRFLQYGFQSLSNYPETGHVYFINLIDYMANEYWNR